MAAYNHLEMEHKGAFQELWRAKTQYIIMHSFTLIYITQSLIVTRKPGQFNAEAVF